MVNKSMVWIVVVLLVLIVLAGVYFTRDSGDSMANNNGNTINADSDSVVGDGDSLIVDATFIMAGENFKFVMNGEDNPDLVVNEGDLVRVEFTSASGFHDWVVDEFDAATAQVRDGKGIVVEFVADVKGEFEYYCSVGQYRTNGMKGKLIVQ